PPESGGVISLSFDPRSPSAAAATECSVNGPWKFAQAVSAPAASSQSHTTPYVSTGQHVQRGKTKRPPHTTSARSNAASTSPYEKERSETTIPCSGSMTGSSGSYSTSISSAASSAR